MLQFQQHAFYLFIVLINEEAVIEFVTLANVCVYL